MSSANGEDGGYVKLEEGNESQQQHQQQQKQPATLESIQGSPWLVWPVFALSNFAGGTAGPVTVLMQNVNPISVVGWRHQISSLIMLPGFIYQSILLEPSKRKKFWSLPNLSLHFLCSLAIAGHFLTYSLAIYRTSVPHCLFLMSTSSVYVALFVKITGGALHPLELGGIFLSLLGMGALAVGNALESGGKSSHSGDFLAIISALFTAAYLIVGKSLRGWMPLFIYQFPVAVWCMIVLGVGGLVSELWTGSNAGLASGPFDWFSKEYLWPTLWLGVLPGVIGHAGYSYILRYSAPLVLPTGFSLQPIIGSVLSWLIGQTAVPGVWTWIGGVVILCGVTVVNVASNFKKEKSETGDSNGKHHDTSEGEHVQKPLLNDHS